MSKLNVGDTVVVRDHDNGIERADRVQMTGCSLSVAMPDGKFVHISDDVSFLTKMYERPIIGIGPRVVTHNGKPYGKSILEDLYPEWERFLKRRSDG